MKRCEICGAIIVGNNSRTIELLGAEMEKAVKDKRKTVQLVCIDCKDTLLYAGIITPY